LKVGSPGSYEIKQRNVNTANASNAIATTSFTRECFGRAAFFEQRRAVGQTEVKIFVRVGLFCMLGKSS
jgi:hypothetical protein